MLRVLVAVAAIVGVALAAVFGLQHKLDHKAEHMAKGSDEERRNAAALREISRKIDQGRGGYPQL